MIRTSPLVAALAAAAVSMGGCVKLPHGVGGVLADPGSCGNDKLDNDESDVDCGSSCDRCSAGQHCRSNEDCADDNCEGGLCIPMGSTCFDHAKDGPETDLDCGGGCARCADGKTCAAASDCESGSCVAGLCAASSSPPFSFAPGRFADAGKGASSLAVGDLDGDGRLDVVTANQRAGNVTVLAGTADGTLRSGVAFGTFEEPGWVGIADLDQDGRPDVVVLARGESGFAVLRNRGGLDFGGEPQRVSSPMSSQPISGALADFDGDGRVDVALVAGGSGSVLLFHALGGGRFDGGTQLGGQGIGPSRLVAGDVDGDGRPDLAVVADMVIKVLHGPSFTSKDVMPPMRPWNVTLAALRAGGPRDLVASGIDGQIAVSLGSGDATFGAATTYLTGSAPLSAAAADFDGDGKVDLATCNVGSSNVSLLAGHGDGTFEPAINRWLGGSPQEMVAADMNGDGRPDLVLCDYWQHDVGVLLNLKK